MSGRNGNPAGITSNTLGFDAESEVMRSAPDLPVAYASNTSDSDIEFILSLVNSQGWRRKRYTVLLSH